MDLKLFDPTLFLFSDHISVFSLAACFFSSHKIQCAEMICKRTSESWFMGISWGCMEETGTTCISKTCHMKSACALILAKEWLDVFVLYNGLSCWEGLGSLFSWAKDIIQLVPGERVRLWGMIYEMFCISDVLRVLFFMLRTHTKWGHFFCHSCKWQILHMNVAYWPVCNLLIYFILLI